MGMAGYRLTNDAGSADVAIVTTCAFLNSAVAESERIIRQLLAIKRRRPGMKLVVAGCLVQRFRTHIRQRLAGVDLFVGLDAFIDIPKLLKNGETFTASFPPSRILTSRNPRLLSTPKHYAYLKIADGCNNHCTYCLIPGIRGSLRSRPVPDIIREAEDLARAGVKEIMLIAQDTTAYGLDIYCRPALSRLLRKLSNINGIHWLRLMYTHPAHITDELIDEFSSNPKLCRYIDLPIQHISNRILRRMNRHYRRDDVERLLARLRSIPDMRIRTTLITGFPAETRKEFNELLEFIKTSRFDRLGAYAYSAEPGTIASQMRNQIPEPVKQERLKELMQVQARISRRNLQHLRGRKLTVLMDAADTGRTEWDAPEIDGVVNLPETAKTGTYITALVTNTRTHDIVGRPVRARN